jgi:hypothetical protein
MSESSEAWRYSFENDLSGRIFCWIVESSRIDTTAMIENALEKAPSQKKAVKRLASTLKEAFECHPEWLSACHEPRPATPPSGRKAPPYRLWFRPSASEKPRFKKTAHALLGFEGRLPPDAREAPGPKP